MHKQWYAVAWNVSANFIEKKICCEWKESVNWSTRNHCNQRGYSTVKKDDDLKMHMMVHSGEKPFVCKQCNYSCTTASILKRHMLTHSGEKPFVCTQCSYSSTTAGNLKAHLLTHSGEKPFSCTKCNYCCTTAGSLKTHLLSFGRKTFQLHTVWILLHNNILPQETHVDAFRREAFQVWPVQLFMCSS